MATPAQTDVERVALAMARVSAHSCWRGSDDKPYPPESLVKELATELVPLAEAAIAEMKK